MAKDSLKQIPLATDADMRAKTLELVDQGYRITSQSLELVQLERKRRVISGPEVIITVLLLCLCVIPGVVYVWVVLIRNQRVERITLRVDPGAAAAEAAARAAADAAARDAAAARAAGSSSRAKGTPLEPAPAGTAEGWLPDPSGRHPDRYWDGKAWTIWVRDKPGGTRSEDPPVASPPATTPTASEDLQSATPPASHPGSTATES
jgi:hypothetical protein